MEKSRNDKIKTYLLIVLDVALIIIAALAAVRYTNSYQEERRQHRMEAFQTSVDTIKKVSDQYFYTETVRTREWAQYIEANELTMDEALDYIRIVNARDDRYAHIVDMDTYEARSTLIVNGSDIDNTYIHYQEDDDQTSIELFNALNGMLYARENDIRIAGLYYDEVIEKNAICVGIPVVIRGLDGGSKKYLLLRIIPEDSLLQSWIFTMNYDGAHTGVITESGRYIMRSEGMDGANFVDYIQENNFPGDDAQATELRRMLDATTSGLLEYQDAHNRDTYYYYVNADTNARVLIVGYIPVNVLENDGTNWGNVIIVSLVGVLLLLFNGIYLLNINTRLRESMVKANLANEAKTNFLSSMSHDIRTPMNAIIGMTTIARKHLDDKKYAAECLDKVALASNHLLTLINDILDISKVESGRMTLNPTVFSLSEIATNFANIVRPQIGAKAQQFDIRVHRIEHENLFGDELRLNQIFINLVTNAVKYTEPGGRITVDLIEDAVEDNENQVQLTYIVSDTGIGMSKEFQQKMYDSFARATDSRVNKVEGSGLGLAITKQMVELFGGTIECESEENVGTTFTVKLRLQIAERMLDGLVLPPIKLLLVDDDETFLTTATETISSLGVKVDAVSSGKEAVERVVQKEKEHNQYPIVIIDWKMPEMDGVETARQIRKRVGEEVPIIVLSSYDWTEIEEEARAAGVNGFINKPMFKSTVYYKLSEILNLRKEEKSDEEESHPNLEGLQVLVAEDHDFNWDVVDTFLQEHGIHADRARDGKICVEMLNNNLKKYDMILMDVQMPNMNGREATMEIRAHGAEVVRNIPIIAMTADAFAEDIKACLDAGMDAHIAKPINEKTLFDVMNRIMDERKVQTAESGATPRQ